MLHAVEIRFAAEDFREVISRVRGWLNCENAQPRTFRYWLTEPFQWCASILSLKNRREASRRRSAGLFWFSCRQPTGALNCAFRLRVDLQTAWKIADWIELKGIHTTA